MKSTTAVHPSVFGPNILLSAEGKIVSYEIRGLHVWKALVSVGYTILSDADTWVHLLFLSVVCFLRFLFSESAMINKSCYPFDNTVVSRIIYLFGPVFSAYIIIIINRWDRMRNENLGNLCTIEQCVNIFHSSCIFF